ncbi:DivIVA domain-containing protein [Periweissella fabalis]|uniref:DivIVA domain-containing protein n=1 Tax=Periweissella fabalis TaxID=1070421 RepID=A0A7X6N2K4_9LACO|nr:DivIVA domain-containing protein [Periweissella fabalis]MCM0598785.1 DivIVA domain-containing protein [Periweissella fabalis]NKZ24616.1 DivIVA domain-containing protein [Periweissella fabalis]
MALTPIDIQNKEFTKSGRKGYEATEVNNYLDQIITDFAAVIEENQQLKTRVADYEANDTQIEEMKQSVTQSILVAQEAADRLKRTADESAKKTLAKAQEEAHRLVNEALTKSNEMLADAESKSNEMLSKAAHENEKMLRETDAIKRDTFEFKDKSLALLQAQMDLIKSQDWSGLTTEVGLTNSPATQEYLEENQAEVIDIPAEDSVNSNVVEDTTTAEDDQDSQTYIVMPEVVPGEKF